MANLDEYVRKHTKIKGIQGKITDSKRFTI